MTTLPDHVYETYDNYLASPDYCEPEPLDAAWKQAFLRQCQTGTLPTAPRCNSEVKHRKAGMWWWVAELQAEVCCYCHPSSINPSKALILDWLPQERRDAFLKLLVKGQRPAQVSSTPQKQPVDPQLTPEERPKAFRLLG